MSIALQRENGDLIWFDAVLNYRRSYTSSVSRHPIENGGNVTDNVVKENPQFSISGVISNADFNTMRPFITSSDAAAFGISERRIYNSQPIPAGAGPVIGAGVSPALSRFPIIGQFFEGQPPSVVVPDSKRPDWVFEVSGILTDIERDHELVAILEFKNNVVSQLIDNVYITNISFDEDENTGDSVKANISCEQVEFVTLLTENINTNVAGYKTENAAKQNKGNVSAENTGESEVLPDGKTETKTNNQSELLKLKNSLGGRL